MIFPAISTLKINEQDILSLMQTGFCYIKLSSASLLNKIQLCIRVAKKFFQSPKEEKEKWRLKKNLNLNDRYQGYALRTQSQNTHFIEQLFFEPDSPFGPYELYSMLIQEINEYYKDLIFLPVMNAIFTKLEISHENFIQITQDPYCSLVFQSCPAITENKHVIRLNAHKDFGILTIVFFEEPGLEVKYQNNWHPIPPKEGHVVVNLGNATELMTAKHCQSALHRVTNATDDRISMVYFFNPNYQQPVKNYINNTIIAPTGKIFFTQQFQEYYQVNH